VPRGLFHDQRGQSSMMVISLLLVFMCFMAMVANVGQAVNRRIAVQMMADASAWTGATNQAIGLNKMAELNLYLQEFWTALTQAQGGFALPQCAIAQPALAIYKDLAAVVRKASDAINKRYSHVAHQEALRMTNYNLEDLFPGEDKSLFTLAGPGAERDGSLAKTSAVPDGTEPNTSGARSPARSSIGWACLDVTTMNPLPMVEAFGDHLWQTRTDPGSTQFWWYVKAPATRALLLDELLGPNAIPEMEAVSAAKPIGGTIQTGQQQYVTKLIPVASTATSGMGWWHITGFRTSEGVLDTFRGVTRVMTH
jgi:hypothetical protein